MFLLGNKMMHLVHCPPKEMIIYFFGKGNDKVKKTIRLELESNILQQHQNYGTIIECHMKRWVICMGKIGLLSCSSILATAECRLISRKTFPTSVLHNVYTWSSLWASWLACVPYLLVDNSRFFLIFIFIDKGQPKKLLILNYLHHWFSNLKF